MVNDVVHIKNGADRFSHCRKDLLACSYSPHLFVEGYSPDRIVYPVLRIINIEESYPILEQVEVCKESLNFCGSCLSDIGMRLLYNLGSPVRRAMYAYALR